MQKIIRKKFGIKSRNNGEREDLPMKMKPDDIQKITSHVMKRILDDLHRGCSGEIGYIDSPFWEAIDTVYREYEIHGCYMCDKDIDPNAVPFDFPDSSKLCMTCMMKLANIMKAFGIAPRSLIPDIGERKIQPIIYKEVPSLISPSKN